MSLRSTLRSLPAPLRDGLQARFYPNLLAEGETAPEWHLQSWDDTWHRQGKHWSVMVFYVDDAGETDRAQLLAFQAHAADFTRLNVKIFGIQPAESASHKALAAELGLTFPVLTDRGGSVARQFKACLQLPMFPMSLRAVYLVNPERKIRLSNRGTPSVEAIVRSVEALQRATKTGM